MTLTTERPARGTVHSRTSLTAALARMQVALPAVTLYDEDDDSIFCGYSEESIDALLVRLRAQFPGDPDAAVIASVISRAERTDSAVWLDLDQRSVLGLMLNRLADQGPFVNASVPVIRSAFTRLIGALRR